MTLQNYIPITLVALTISFLEVNAVGSRIAYIDAFATARGNAFTATADAPSAVFYNIGGLTQLEGTQVQANVYAFSAEHTFSGEFVSDAKADNHFQPLPNFFAAHKIKNQPFAIGFGMYAPFALGVDWGADAPFAAVGYRSELAYVKHAFALAWKVTDTLSVGIGVSYDNADISLKTAGPLGSIEGDDQTIGHSLSIRWQPSEHHAFGLNYQAATELTFKGHQTNFEVPSFGFFSDSAEADLDFPESITFGYSWRPNEWWNVEFNIDWTNWDKVDDIKITNSFYTTSVPLNWESAFLFDIGATRYFENGWNISVGYTYVENAVSEDDFTPLVPDTNRNFLNVGCGRQYDRFSWQLAYQLSFDTKRTLSNTPTSLSDPSLLTNGEYDLQSQSLAFSVAYKF